MKKIQAWDIEIWQEIFISYWKPPVWNKFLYEIFISYRKYKSRRIFFLKFHSYRVSKYHVNKYFSIRIIFLQWYIIILKVNISPASWDTLKLKCYVLFIIDWQFSIWYKWFIHCNITASYAGANMPPWHWNIQCFWPFNFGL